MALASKVSDILIPFVSDFVSGLSTNLRLFVFLFRNRDGSCVSHPNETFLPSTISRGRKNRESIDFQWLYDLTAPFSGL